MDAEQLSHRGPQLVLGAFMIALGGLLALYGVMYGPLARPDIDARGATVITDAARNFALLGATAATLLGLGAAYCYRGSVPMLFCSAVVVVAGGHNLLQLLRYF